MNILYKALEFHKRRLCSEGESEQAPNKNFKPISRQETWSPHLTVSSDVSSVAN